MTKTDFDNKVSSLDTKIISNENELKKLRTFDLNYLIRGKSHFEENGEQNYLVFQPINRCFKVIANTQCISSWKSKGLSTENITLSATSDNSLAPALNYYVTKKSKIYWKLFKKTQIIIHSWCNSKHLHCL